MGKIWAKYVICSLSATVIFLVPLSRIILGVHYFTDVLGGLFFGAFVAILGISLYNAYLLRRQKSLAKLANNSASDDTSIVDEDNKNGA